MKNHTWNCKKITFLNIEYFSLCFTNLQWSFYSWVVIFINKPISSCHHFGLRMTSKHQTPWNLCMRRVLNFLLFIYCTYLLLQYTFHNYKKELVHFNVTLYLANNPGNYNPMLYGYLSHCRLLNEPTLPNGFSNKLFLEFLPYLADLSKLQQFPIGINYNITQDSFFPLLLSYYWTQDCIQKPTFLRNINSNEMLRFFLLKNIFRDCAWE